MRDPNTAVLPRWSSTLAGLLCAGLSTMAHAQSRTEDAAFGLKYVPEATAVFELPFDQHWGMRSSVSNGGVSAGQGLKVGVAGTYGWNLGARTRFAVSAGVVNVESASLLPGLAVGVNRLQFGGGARGVDARDISFNLSVDWRYSSALSITTGLDISYSLLDPLPLDWQGVARPSSSLGFVGLKYRF